jgi:sugar phosphate isomerase/epimerase
MKYAICNELFGAMEFRKSLALLAEHGYTGVEIAPYTLFGDFSPSAVRKGLDEARKALAGSGINFAGLHWLFVKPEDLHVTSADPILRKRSWDHLRLLLDIAGELGGGALIFGSPKQRASRGIPKAEAMKYFIEGLREAADYARERKSEVLVESLASKDTDIVNTGDEAAEVVRAVGRPGVAGMFDFHNTRDEMEPWAAIVEKHWDIIRHVHVNEMDGSWPAGRGKADFGPVFSLLHRRKFEGWVSLEIFTVPEDPVRVLTETMNFLVNMEKIV